MWFDEAVVQGVVEFIPPWLGVLLLLVSYLGSVYVLAPATAVGYLWGPRERTATWPVVILGTYATFVVLKPLFDTPRPAVGPPLARETLPDFLRVVHDLAVDFESGGLPSGHATAVTVFASLAVFDLEFGSRHQRLAGAVALVPAVCFARVALGTHYPVDVLFGSLLGLVLFGIVVTVRRRAADPVVPLAALAVFPTLGGLLFYPAQALIILGTLVVAVVVDRLQFRKTFPASLPLPGS